MAEKPWQLRGEVMSGGRPVNSLLETVVDFTSASKPTPMPTEEVASHYVCLLMYASLRACNHVVCAYFIMYVCSLHACNHECNDNVCAYFIMYV